MNTTNDQTPSGYSSTPPPPKEPPKPDRAVISYAEGWGLPIGLGQNVILFGLQWRVVTSTPFGRRLAARLGNPSRRVLFNLAALPAVAFSLVDIALYKASVRQVAERRAWEASAAAVPGATSTFESVGGLDDSEGDRDSGDRWA